MSTLAISIRRARASDAEALAGVFEAAWREAYLGIIPGAALARLVARRGPAWWRTTATRGRPLVVLDAGRGLAGYATYGRCRDRALGAEGEIDELYLAPEYQGLGFGRRLFRAVRNDLKDRGARGLAVWCLAENTRARDFYEGLGGRIAAEGRTAVAGAPLPRVAFLFA